MTAVRHYIAPRGDDRYSLPLIVSLPAEPWEAPTDRDAILLERRARDHGRRTMQDRVLALMQPDASAKALARALRIEGKHINNILRAMEARGLIAKTDAGAWRRVK